MWLEIPQIWADLTANASRVESSSKIKTSKGQLNWVARIFSLQFSQEATKTQRALPSSSCVGKWRDRCSYSSSTQVITKLGVCLLNHCQITCPLQTPALKVKDRDNQRAANLVTTSGCAINTSWFSWSSDGQITTCMTSIYGVQFVQI